MYASVPAIHEVYKRVEKHNKISGHRWSEDGALTGYEVTGGGFMRTKHRNLKGAEKELSLREKLIVHVYMPTN